MTEIVIGTGNRRNYISARNEGGGDADAHGEWAGGDEQLRIIRGPDGRVAFVSLRGYILAAERDGTFNFKRKFEPPAFPENWVPNGYEGFTPQRGPEGSEALVTDHGTTLAANWGGGQGLYHHVPPNGIGGDEMLFPSRSFFASAGGGTPGGLNRQQITVDPRGGYLVGGQPRLITSKHDGSALSQWFYKREECMRRLRITAEVGYLMLRTWWDVDGPYWEGRADRGHWPGDRDRTLYPDKYGEQEYVRGCVEFLQFVESLGMAVHVARGTGTSTSWDRMAEIVREIIRQAGVHVIGVGEGVNEHDAVTPDTPVGTVTRFRERAYEGVGLRCNSAIGGFDVDAVFVNRDRLLEYNPGANVIPFHGFRGYQWANKLERDWNVRYEWHIEHAIDGEGVGTGHYTSDTQNKEQLNRAFFMIRHALMHCCGTIPTKMDGAGVIPDGPMSEDWGSQPGFDGVCKVVDMLPAHAGHFRKVFHGGDRWGNHRIYRAIGDTRVEHHVNEETGEAIIVAYGDEASRIPKAQSFDVAGDHWIEDGHIKGRVIVGQL
jgi:hypothetical protein